MIGRAALGRPWIFREIAHFLTTGQRISPPGPAEIRRVLLSHLDAMYAFYGERAAVGIARKHIAWYVKGLPGCAAFLRRTFQLPTMAEQRAAVDRFLTERETASHPHPSSRELAA
jgi:tRNA-dihydrouridine synthase B